MIDHHGLNGMTNDAWRTPLPLTTRESITTRAGEGVGSRRVTRDGVCVAMRERGEGWHERVHRGRGVKGEVVMRQKTGRGK